MATDLLSMEFYEPSVCEVGGSGIILPLFGQGEQGWPNGLRTVLYFAGLLWLFLGIAIISDIFMAAIEQITSKQTIMYMNVGDKKRRFHVKVWNYTVANLTLMALGSSAPEIMLSVIELIGKEYYTGSLGPSTIVGSAAFNLFMITPVCILAIPSPEVRFIRSKQVFMATAISSVLAYFWMLLILVGTSPDVITIAEGVITLVFFPLLVIIAYALDIGWHKKILGRIISSSMDEEEPQNIDRAEFVANQMRKIKQENPDITAQDASQILQREMSKREPRTRAFHRIKAMRKFVGAGQTHQARNKVSAMTIAPTDEGTQGGNGSSSGTGAVQVQDVNSDFSDSGTSQSVVGFAAARYACSESQGEVVLTVRRGGMLSQTMVLQYTTKDGTAKSTEKYIATTGSLQFASGQETAEIRVSLVDNDTYDGDLDFEVILSDVQSSVQTTISQASTKVTIFDDDDPGVILFSQDTYFCCESEKVALVKVSRDKGSGARVSCSYRCEPGSAQPGKDYQDVEGTLEFIPGQTEAVIEIPIFNDESYEKDEFFKVILFNPVGGVKFDEQTDGGAESCIAVIQIFSDDAVKSNVDKMLGMIDMHVAGNHATSYKEQFVAAMYCGGSKEEQAESGWIEYILHLVSLPFKILFAFCPPTSIWGGWATFLVAITFIGFLTAIVGDMAALLGCCMGIEDYITAMTFVAIGTSLPDTFASKTAAREDPFADASIGNITGSNSVNVFLGLGLPWTIGSIYWSVGSEADPKWLAKYGPAGPHASLRIAEQYPNGAFAVPAGNLGFGVAVFATCACICLGLLGFRRWKYGGELGGPRVPQVISACCCASLWVIYIVLSILEPQITGSGSA